MIVPFIEVKDCINNKMLSGFLIILCWESQKSYNTKDEYYLSLEI